MPFDGATELSPTKSFRIFGVWKDFLAFVNKPAQPPPEPMPLRILRDAKALIVDESHWTRGMYVRKTNDGITQRCAVGALRAASQRLRADIDEFRLAQSMMHIVVQTRSVLGGCSPKSVEYTNDRSSHAQVMALFDETITIASLSIH